MSNFPDSLDTDLEIPQIDEGVTEIGGDVINAIRDAVFAIQGAIGTSPQGTKSNLAARLNVSINADGTIKQSALSSAGLVTLPITNAQVGTNAGILESKLNLDFSTQSLNNSVSSLSSTLTAVTTSLNTTGASFSGHTAGTAFRHDGYQIDIAGIGVTGLSATTVGAAVNEIAGILFGELNGGTSHIDLSLPANIHHPASKISVDTSAFTTLDTSVSTVQEALDNIDEDSASQQVSHTDRFHANGILKEISAGSSFNSNQQRISSNAVSYTIEKAIIDFTGLAVSFASLGVKRGDIVAVESGNDAGNYQVLDVGPMTASETLGDIEALTATQLRVLHTFCETSTSTASVYGPASISSENAPLACAIRKIDAKVDNVAVMNPNAARVVSLGFNGVTFNPLPGDADGYAIGVEVGFGNGIYRSIKIPNLEEEGTGGGKADPVSATSVAERINAYVSDATVGQHFPIAAYRVGNEIAIAHNLVGTDYTIEILDGYTANLAMGFDENGADILDEVITGNSSNQFVVNGKSLSTLATKVSGTITIGSGTTSTTTLTLSVGGSPINPAKFGVKPGDMLHITGHPTLDTNGSYFLDTAGSSNVSVLSGDDVDNPNSPGSDITFNFSITNSNVSLNDLASAEDDKGIVEILVDENGVVFPHQRLVYDAAPGLGAAVELAGVSDTFPEGTFSVNIASDGNLRRFNILDSSISGTVVDIDQDFKGSFKLYHSNGIDFLTVNIIGGTVIPASANFTVNPPLNKDEAFSLCAVHFDSGSDLSHLIDKRQFGTLGVNEARDDFLEVFAQRVTRELRSDGVARGFDLLSLSFQDALTGMQAVPVGGGTAYVRGVRVVVETQKVVVPSYDESNVLLPTTTFVIGVNEFGTIRAFTDTLGEMLEDGYNASSVFGKIVPLYQVDLVNGLIDKVVDVRRFINNLDEKVELIVDETNNVVGSFRTLEGALLHAQAYPGSEKLTIKIVNSVFPSRQVIVPAGVSLVGGLTYGGSGLHRIVNQNNLVDSFIILSGNNDLKNIQIESDTVSLNGPLVLVNGSNVLVEKCKFTFTDTVGSIAANTGDLAMRLSTNAAQNVSIKDNRIDTVFAGIEAEFGCDNLHISENIIENILGGDLAVASAIKIGSSARTVDRVYMKENLITIPTVATSDIRGIDIDVGNIIEVVKVVDNEIVHKNGDTVTNGIRVENVAATGNKIEELTIRDNLIRGIQLTGSNDIYGIFIADVNRVDIHHNKLRDVGNAGNTNNEYIRIDTDVDFASITNNIIEGGGVSTGINIADATTSHISGNRLNSIDSGATYISGDGLNSKIYGNILTGPGDTGISWSGDNTAISDNTLDALGGPSFSSTGIIHSGQRGDIDGNVLLNIVTVSATAISVSGFNASVRNNTVSNAGNSLTAIIESTGDNDVILGNTLRAGGTDGISISGDNVEVYGNSIFGGALTNGIGAAGSVDACKIVGNRVTGTVTNSINAPTATNCLVESNYFPDTDANIGVDPEEFVTNTNIIGINKGLLDTIDIGLAEGISNSAEVSGNIHLPGWYLGVGSDTLPLHGWRANANGLTAGDDRNLFFPINKVPNGARIVSVACTGWMPNAASLTISIYKRSIDHTRDVDPFGTILTNSSVISVAGDFDGTTAGSGLASLSTPEVVNNKQFNYYVRAVTTSSLSAGFEPVILTVKATIRY